MFRGTAVVDRVAVRRLLILSGLLVGLLVPASASAAITSVFGGTVTCTTQSAVGEEGQRWCGTTAGTTVKTWDGITPIDVAMAFPAATGSDNNYPVVGIYPPWGSTKILPNSAAAQRWLKLGYAVFSESNRGWGSSCGGPTKPAGMLKPAPCEDGYIHTMGRAYEPHDVQYLLGLLAEEGVINPQEIGATGGSNGGGMSMQLGSLDGRVQLTNGELVPWTTKNGTPMKTAAIAPEYPWSDLSQSLQPNGSNLDYVAEAPYSGMLGNHEFGIQKKFWNEELYQAGALLGYYAPTSINDPEANNTEWYNFANTGGPYNGLPLAVQEEEHLPNHGAYYTSLAEPPAPALMENGWNDDLFPVDQTVDYYNKVRSVYPNAAMKLFDMDLGHNPRSASTPSTADLAKLAAAQNAWFEYFVKGQGSEPEGARGGVVAISSHCPATSASSGTEYKAANWASLAPGEINLQGAAQQTIEAPGIAPKTAFTSGTVCTTEAAGENASAATYKLAPAPSEGFTIAGSSTVIGEFSTPITNDQIIARLMDVAENGETAARRARHLQAHQPGRRLHQAGLPAAPAGVERSRGARPEAAAADLRLGLRTQLLERHHERRVDQRQEPRTARADYPETGQRRRIDRKATAEVPAAGLHPVTQRDAGPAECTAPLERRHAEREWCIHACVGTSAGGDCQHLHAAAEGRGRRLGNGREWPHEPRIRLHEWRTRGRRDVDVPRLREQRKP